MFDSIIVRCKLHTAICAHITLAVNGFGPSSTYKALFRMRSCVMMNHIVTKSRNAFSLGFTARAMVGLGTSSCASRLCSYRATIPAMGMRLWLIGRTVIATAVVVAVAIGISGTNTKKREDFNRMIDDCEAGNIDMIITKSISRFARNTLDCLKYIRQLKDKNIPVFFEREAINTMDAKGEVLITIMASLAQQESQSLSQNVKLGLHFRYQNGQVQVNHNHFLGYTKDADENLIIDPEQAEVVKRIYREYREGIFYIHKPELS